METLTVTSNLLVPSSKGEPLTPAMLTVLWVIADELDRQRVPATVEEAIWLEIPSKHLRGRHGRNDNIWLRECLRRFVRLEILGEYRSVPWGAAMIAEWRIEQGGALCKLLIPPAAVQALRLSETFAKIETEAAYRLQGPARRLYAALADKKRMGKPHWTYSLDELRALFNVTSKKSYERWQALKQWVLIPAIEQINDFGTVVVKMTPIKRGRSVVAVRFDWRWKTIDEARETAKSPTATPQESGEDQKPRSEEEKRRGLEAIAEAKRKLAAAKPPKKRASAIERLPGEQPLPLGLPDEEEGLKPASDYLPDKKAASG